MARSRLGVTKRPANVPPVAVVFASSVSKADLLEAAWHLAGIASDRYGDDKAHFATLVNELQVLRENDGRPRLKVRHLPEVSAIGRRHENRADECPACWLPKEG
jgi:hypothetical protein